MDRPVLQLMAVEYIVNTDVDLKGTVTLAWVLILLGHEVVRDRSIMPLVDGSIYLIAIGNRPSKPHCCTVDIIASVQIVIAHPL
jgi:hypothetical protein